MFSDECIISELASQIPRDIILVLDTDIHAYRQDASPDTGVRPICVVLVNEVSHIQHCLRVAHAHKIAIICRGAGTGTTGGALATHSRSIILSLEKLDQICEIDVVNRTARVEAGVITGQLQDEVAKLGLFYPPDPASLDRCTIGGNVAENAGGPHAVKYGVTRDYVLGIEGFYADGTPFSFGGQLYKDVAGYDIKQLFIGSEGTLGVISHVTLRLLPLPRFRWDITVGFSAFDVAIGALSSMMQSGISLAAAEFMDATCLAAVQRYKPELDVDLGLGAQLIFSVDSDSEGALEDVVSRVQELLIDAGAVGVEVAKSDGEKAALWAQRRSVSDALKAEYKAKISHDIVVPPGAIGACLTEIRNLSSEFPLYFLGYGHLGDGNIHVNVLNKDLGESEWTVLVPEVSRRVFEICLAYEGSISGEHGIGVSKAAYLDMMFGSRELKLFRSIKLAFDPGDILNPGKWV